MFLITAPQCTGISSLLLSSGGQDSFGNVNCPSVKFRTAKNFEWRVQSETTAGVLSTYTTSLSYRIKLYTSISSLLPLEDCTIMVG
jgi:hypothetical protein